MPHSHGCLHSLAHDVDRAFEVEAFTRAHVQLQGDGIQLFLAVYRQVCALGQVLTNQTVDVFIAAALLGAVGGAEEDRHTGSLGDLGMPRKLKPWA
jgi:allantoicase